MQLPVMPGAGHSTQEGSAQALLSLRSRTESATSAGASDPQETSSFLQELERLLYGSDRISPEQHVTRDSTGPDSSFRSDPATNGSGVHRPAELRADTAESYRDERHLQARHDAQKADARDRDRDSLERSQEAQARADVRSAKKGDRDHALSGQNAEDAQHPIGEPSKHTKSAREDGSTNTSNDRSADTSGDTSGRAGAARDAAAKAMKEGKSSDAPAALAPHLDSSGQSKLTGKSKPNADANPAQSLQGLSWRDGAEPGKTGDRQSHAQAKAAERSSTAGADAARLEQASAQASAHAPVAGGTHHTSRNSHTDDTRSDSAHKSGQALLDPAKKFASADSVTDAASQKGTGNQFSDSRGEGLRIELVTRKSGTTRQAAASDAHRQVEGKGAEQGSQKVSGGSESALQPGTQNAGQMSGEAPTVQGVESRGELLRADVAQKAELARELRSNTNTEIVKQARIVLKDADSGEIRLMLKPAELGSVRIQLSMQDSHIAGRIFVENSSIRDVFLQNLQELQDAFRSQGIDPGAIDVSVEGEGQEGAGDQESRDSEHLTGIQDLQDAVQDADVSIREMSRVDITV